MLAHKASGLQTFSSDRVETKTDDGKEDVTASNNRTYEEELLRSIFNICDSNAEVSWKFSAQIFSDTHSLVLSVVREREMVMCGALCICVYIWQVQPNLGGDGCLDVG